MGISRSVLSACFSLALMLCVDGSQILPGTRAALYGDLVDRSDFHVVLHPPAQSTQDVRESVDENMKREEMIHSANEQMFNEDKQHMVTQEKREVRRLVSKALQSELLR